MKANESLWKGPEEDGITQSMLSTFIQCRERFRIRYVLGLRPADTFLHRLEYGQMWHCCEEAHAKGDITSDPLKEYTKGLCSRYKAQQEQVEHWYNVCRQQFPVYVKYWSKHNHVRNRVPLFQEETFSVYYNLPSGRTVLLRGKWDSVDAIGSGKAARVYLQENKTKGDIDEQQIKNQLRFDLQTMIYLVALDQTLDPSRFAIAGVVYNVVRRPLSGGKDSIRQKKDETPDEFYTRLGGLIADHPQEYFMRWTAEVTSQDLERFKQQFLTPILEQLCDWWDWISSADDPFADGGGGGLHWRTPYGMYNVLAEGGATELDEYLDTGSELGLVRAKELFTELG